MPSSPAAASSTARRTGRRPLVAVTALFLLLIAGGTLPIPLYRLWAPTLHFGAFTTVLLFVAYAIGVVATLLVAGRLSDTAGRRPLVALALLAAVLSTVLFAIGGSVTVLLIARLLSGVAAGAAVPSATAWVGDLSGSRTVAATLSGVGNFGGFATGTVASGVIAQATGSISAVFLVYLVVLVVLAVIVWRSRETVQDRRRTVPRPARPTLPDAGRARGAFLGATLVAAAGFAVNGAFSSLVPQFLHSGLGVSSPAVVGVLVGVVFLTALAAQRLMPALVVRTPVLIAALVALGAIGVQIALASGAVWLFVVATLVSGTGIGWAVRRGLLVTDEVADPEHRAALNATYSLGTYSGLIVPTLLLGVLQQTIGEPVSTIAFTALVLVTTAAGAILSARNPLENQEPAR